MTESATYLVDSDVFITAKNLYYAFALCPGFWKSVLHHHRKGRIFSVDRVRSELLAGASEEDLVRWVKDEVPPGFFLAVDADGVVDAYREIMEWVQGHERYFDHAKANERGAPDSRREIKLPDVCEEFGVAHPNVFEMLRALDVRFDWTGTPL